jgi:tRNA U34 5-methylaminomethyl-2-thiouridine-forming methyltransferase MnmC
MGIEFCVTRLSNASYGSSVMKTVTAPFELVRLANGACSLRSSAHGETFHPVVGPVAEASALYVDQARLPQRMAGCPREFVIWDVGLGAAANAVAVLLATRDLRCDVRMVSFDHTLEPLAFALRHADELGYFHGYQSALGELSQTGRTIIKETSRTVQWRLVLADFPTWLREVEQKKARGATEMVGELPSAPDAILYDAYSPAKNPAMWTLPVFARLFGALNPTRPCTLATYSRSTLLRATLLLAGFFVGRGNATGEKEETTVAANALDLIERPLDARWLVRARNSTSAEPLMADVYRQTPLTPASWERLRQHPQFTHNI